MILSRAPTMYHTHRHSFARNRIADTRSSPFRGRSGLLSDPTGGVGAGQACAIMLTHAPPPHRTPIPGARAPRAARTARRLPCGTRTSFLAVPSFGMSGMPLDRHLSDGHDHGLGWSGECSPTGDVLGEVT